MVALERAMALSADRMAASGGFGVAERRVAVYETLERPLLPIIAEAEHAARIDEVLREILADPDAAFRTVAVLYQDFLVRCRIRRVPGEPLTLAEFRRRFAVARAGVDTTKEGEEGWSRAVELSAALPDDLQGVFLVLARAALTGAPCPSDATIARVYGSHSPSRARRLLAYFEERGLLVIRTDFKGRRIIASPDLACETAPGSTAPDPPPTSAAMDAEWCGATKGGTTSRPVGGAAPTRERTARVSSACSRSEPPEAAEAADFLGAIIPLAWIVGAGPLDERPDGAAAHQRMDGVRQHKTDRGGCRSAAPKGACDQQLWSLRGPPAPPGTARPPGQRPGCRRAKRR